MIRLHASAGSLPGQHRFDFPETFPVSVFPLFSKAADSNKAPKQRQSCCCLCGKFYFCFNAEVSPSPPAIEPFSLFRHRVNQLSPALYHYCFCCVRASPLLLISSRLIASLPRCFNLLLINTAVHQPPPTPTPTPTPASLSPSPVLLLSSSSGRQRRKRRGILQLLSPLSLLLLLLLFMAAVIYFLPAADYGGGT